MKNLIFICLVCLIFSGCATTFNRQGKIETLNGKIITFDDAMVQYNSNTYYIIDGHIEYIIPISIVKEIQIKYKNK